MDAMRLDPDARLRIARGCYFALLSFESMFEYLGR